MKKLKYLFLILLFFVGLGNFQADMMGNFYSHFEVLENGDLHVRELIFLEGQVNNGYEREITYASRNVPQFKQDLASFEQSDLYNYDDIEILEVRYLEKPGIVRFSDMEREGVVAQRVASAQDGEFGKYTVRMQLAEGAYSYLIRMYNPGSNAYDIFYLEYIMKNVVVVHDDVAEIYLNLFSDRQREAIRDMQVKINIPGNQTEARIWGQGPLHGNTEVISQEEFLFSIQNLPARTPVTMRLVFDKDVINEVNKTSDMEGLPLILEVEQARADEANRERLVYQAIFYFLWAIAAVWFFLLLKAVIAARNENKPYQSTFNTRYFRDFPNDYNPTTVSFLLNKKIEKRDISASILDLVERKVISYQVEKKNNYVFTKNEGKFELAKSEEYLLGFLFGDIGKKASVSGVNSSQFRIRDINNYAKKHSEKFVQKYDTWVAMVTAEAREHNFFYETTAEQKKVFTIASLGFLFAIIAFILSNFVAALSSFIISIIMIVYVSSFNKRTKEANESYRRWLGLKHFLDDFGNFKERELPKIELWGKYMVYAVVFGNAAKLAKQMKVKFKEVPNNQNFANDMLLIGSYSMLNTSLSRNFTSGFSTASRAIASQASSAGGFGGGFSGGGGFGGGGGGGGRF